jgi:glycosyltransferase involved in cell wall biosynthesis
LQGAGAVVFPSLYEGFGLPPIEAAASGIPLLVSKIPPHEEALRDLQAGEAIWLDPQDTDSWAQAMKNAVHGQVQPAGSVSRQRLLSRYSVSKMGSDMDLIYKNVLGLKS